MAVPPHTLMTVQALKGADRSQQTPFASLLLVRKISVRTAKNDNPFLMVELGDRTGAFNCTCFGDGPAFEVLRSLREGALVRVEGRIEYYQSRLSPRLLKVELLTEEELKRPEILETLVEIAPEDPDLLWKEIGRFAGTIRHPELRATVQAVFEEIGQAFRVAPAAVSMHHSYRHGLMEHTAHMARAAERVLPLYPEVDPDLAMAGILLHDVGKTVEYEGLLATRRSRHGILHGHVVLGFQIVRKAALKSKLAPQLTERLEHIILSHQGELEWGAAALAATPEAVFVSMIDNLDAKMGMVQRALRQAPEGEEFSERLPGLNTQLLLTPPATQPPSGGEEPPAAP